jgi:hypothetical protein
MIAGRTSSSLLQRPVPVRSRSVSVQLLYQCWLHGQTITTVISVRMPKQKDEILSQDRPLDHEFLFLFFIQNLGHQMFRIFREKSFWR